MPKSLSKTPAPKKDRIYGSDKNKVGSASSKASAKGIELNESILATLSQKAKDYNESHPKNKVSVATLKAVMRRGMGAYSTSHRPTITSGAPNSRQAWGFARVNKFLKKKAGQQVKAAYVQDDDLMEKGGFIAPNGKKSNLTPEQYKLVRTPEFKSWFGDWENNPKNASKVVDENGEPLVVYHGTDADFTIFKIKPRTDSLDNELYRSGMWFFAPSFQKNITKEEREYFYREGNAEWMAANWRDKRDKDGNLIENKVLKVFLNVRNPIEVDSYSKFLYLSEDNKTIKNIKNKKNDGWFIYGSTTDGNVYRDDINVFEPNQIKLADGTNKTFDMNNPDIRYADGGSVGQEITCVNCGWHWNTSDSDESDKYICHKCGFDNRTFYDPEPIGFMEDGGSVSDRNLYFQLQEGIDLVFSDYPELNEIGSKKEYFEYLKFYFPSSIKNLIKFRGRRRMYNFENEINDKDLSDYDYYFTDNIRTAYGWGRMYVDNDKDIKIWAALLDNPKANYLGKEGVANEIHRVSNPSYWEYIAKPRQIHLLGGKKDIQMFREWKSKINTNDLTYADGGNLAIPSQHDLIKMELGLELFKPSKTIEQIAKEKDVPLDYAEEQLRKGMKTESEHSENPIVQETIALQHLDEMIDYYEKLEYMENQNKMAKGDLLDKSIFNKALIYKSIKPIRQANEIIERINFMESQNKMEKGGVTEFYKQYQDWYKNGVSDKMTIMVSIPNAFSKMSSEDNHVILDVFEKKDETVDGKEKLKELLELADNNEIDVYLEPIPKHNKIKDEAKKEKITRKYLISYYEKFGFELLPNGFMVRKHKNKKMEKGGYYKAGGEINPDDKNVKDYFSHGSGNVGGVLVGKRHSEGGIKAVNKSTNQPLEMEGGEVVITRNAVSDNEKREFEGKMMTNREILSKINESGGGVSFADGGDIPESIYTSGKEYKYGGKMMKDHEIVSSCGCKHSMAKGGITGDLHSLTDKLLAQKIEIFIKKVQPIKFYYIDEDSNSLIIGLDENYTTGMAEKLHKEATSSAEFFDADSVNMEYNQNTGQAQYSIKLKKVAKFGKGGKMKGKLSAELIHIENGIEYYKNDSLIKPTKEQKLNWEIFGLPEGIEKIEQKFETTIDEFYGNTKKDIENQYNEKLSSAYYDYLGSNPQIILKYNNSMDKGGETDYQTELKNHLFPKIEVEVEVEIEPVTEEMMVNEHYITADDLGLSDGMPMLSVGTIVYSSGGNDQWEVVSFSDDGVNLVNKPKSPLQSKMEDKHLTFDELIKYFKDKAISIKNISTERELEPAIALVKNKLPQKSYAMGGFIDGDEDEDARIMQSQFGKSNFK